MLPHTPLIYQPFYLTLHRPAMILPFSNACHHRVHVDHTWHPCLVIIRHTFVTPYPHCLVDDTHAPPGLSRNKIFTYHHPSSDHRTGDYVVHLPLLRLSPETGMAPPHNLYVDHPIYHTPVYSSLPTTRHSPPFFTFWYFHCGPAGTSSSPDISRLRDLHYSVCVDHVISSHRSFSDEVQSTVLSYVLSHNECERTVSVSSSSPVYFHAHSYY